MERDTPRCRVKQPPLPNTKWLHHSTPSSKPGRQVVLPRQIHGALPRYTSYSPPARLQLGVQDERRLSKPQL